VRVVVVEDDPAVRAVLGRMLRADGHEVSLFASGEEALRALPEGTFLLMTDLNLPGMDGAALWAEMRERRASSRLKAILMSGGPREKMRRQAAAGGFQVFLAKPFSFQQVRQALLRASKLKAPGACHPS